MIIFLLVEIIHLNPILLNENEKGTSNGSFFIEHLSLQFSPAFPPKI